jgi:hypothetical protein
MHALPLLATLVDPYMIFFRRIVPGAGLARFGDEPNPEVRLYLSRRNASEPTRFR